MIPDGVTRSYGKIKFLSRGPKIFGVVVGDDLRDYFFIPSFLEYPAQFHQLVEYIRVEFTPHWTGDKWRAWHISVPSLDLTEIDARGKEDRIHQQ